MIDSDTTEVGEATGVGDRKGTDRTVREVVTLVIAWSRAEPGRVGEVIAVPRGRSAAPCVLGRGPGEGEEVRAAPTRMRPGVNEETGPLTARRISRRQLRLQAMAGGKLMVEQLGRLPLRVRGARVDQAVIGAGDWLEVEGQLLLFATSRAGTLPSARHWRMDGSRPLGAPDRCGLVGESPAMWQLRDLLAFVAGHAGHALVLGRSGVGKELVARALHRLSKRSSGELVARNAATIPASLVDAELFGNARSYPNPGMPERPGLVGEADGSSLFLDEIGELPRELQAHLLRLMDHGEYQRLGESTTRRSDLRLIGATNRPRDQLKPDFAARFRHVVPVPALEERREDLPLLVRHLLYRACAEDPALGSRFVDPETRQPRVDVALIEALLSHPLPLQVRELDALLWQCLGSSPGDRVTGTPALLKTSTANKLANVAVDPSAITREALLECLERHGWVMERVWREMGLGSRYVLRRLIRKHDLTAP